MHFAEDYIRVLKNFNARLFILKKPLESHASKVTSLDNSELESWRKYLDFIENECDRDKVCFVSLRF